MELEEAMLARLEAALARLLRKEDDRRSVAGVPEEPHTSATWELTHCQEDVLHWTSPFAELSQWVIERSGDNYGVHCYCSVRRHLEDREGKAFRAGFGHHHVLRRHEDGVLDQEFRRVAGEMAVMVRDEVLLLATRLRDAGLSEADTAGLFAASLARGVHEP